MIILYLRYRNMCDFGSKDKVVDNFTLLYAYFVDQSCQSFTIYMYV